MMAALAVSHFRIVDFDCNQLMHVRIFDYGADMSVSGTLFVFVLNDSWSTFGKHIVVFVS